MTTLQCTNPSLWMGDLDPFMDENVIRNAFSAMGHTVSYIKFLIDKKTGQPAAYCFVDFGETQLAKKAFHACNGNKMPGVYPVKKFKLNFAFSGGWATKDMGSTSPLTSHGDFSIHVSNLSPDVTDDQLLDYFSGSGRFKSVKNATVVRDGAVSRGYGFVRFQLDNDVVEAIKLFNGAAGLGTKAIRVGRATPFTPKSGPAPYQQQQQQQQQQHQGNYPPPQQYYQTPQQQSAHLSAQYDSGYGVSYHQYKESSNTETNKTVKESGDAPVSATDEDEEDPLVDPEITIDVDKSNRLILERGEELYNALDDSRWQAVDSITMTYDDLCKA
ncbi:tRNA selenocysteine 1-associated protein 1-like [Asterias amurensis]|uniref:tRNA selenocysteine 1-associated protein 1-like n=1 Tax=Asterias amurensis TaxID=7602 RepID=UPI003AB5AA6F